VEFTEGPCFIWMMGLMRLMVAAAWRRKGLRVGSMAKLSRISNYMSMVVRMISRELQEQLCICVTLLTFYYDPFQVC
jgi:hypothetical protein